MRANVCAGDSNRTDAANMRSNKMFFEYSGEATCEPAKGRPIKGTGNAHHIIYTVR